MKNQQPELWLEAPVTAERRCLVLFKCVAVVEDVETRKSLRDFQRQWEGWKTCFWFSRLSTGRHFHITRRRSDENTK